MNKTWAKAIIAVAITAMLLSAIPVSLGQNYTLTYQLQNRSDGDTTYQLQVVVPQELNNYFGSESHRLSSSGDFAKFVTPYAVKPVADRLWQIYDNDEDFANGVLMLVHQITYEQTTPGYYPTETMITGKGDCDLFSYIAASIMKAGRLDVVLFYYQDQEHMNVGVHLDNPPTQARGENYYVKYNNVTYYIAETTGGNWKQGWRVGECPNDYRSISTQVIPLDGAMQVDPGQVSASFNVMEPGSLSMDVSPFIQSENSSLTVKGQISPELQNQNVTIYAKINLSSWEVIGSTLTKPDGSYEISLKTPQSGFYMIQASWSGVDAYTGAVSTTKSALLLPNYFIPLVAGSLIVGFIGLFGYVKTGRRKYKAALNQETPVPANDDYQI